jgi:hypothetical protein
MSLCEDKLKHYRWRWVYGADGEHFYDVWIESDGSLHNPHGYSEERTRAAVLRADVRKADKLAKARKRGVEKRRARQAARIHEAARKIYAEKGVDQQTHCYCCRKYLTDPGSIARGIGPECWQRVLDRVTTLKAVGMGGEIRSGERVPVIIVNADGEEFNLLDALDAAEKAQLSEDESDS